MQIKKSFTLIELMVVIAIIGILGVVITPVVGKAIVKAKVAKTVSDLGTIEDACQVVNLDTGRWPVSPVFPHMGLPVYTSTLSVPPDQTVNWLGGSYSPDDDMQGWDGPYVKAASSKHSWNGVYEVWNTGPGNTNISLHLNNYCYPSGPDAGCLIPDSAGEKIDEILDDGDTASGLFLEDLNQGGQYWWRIFESVL